MKEGYKDYIRRQHLFLRDTLLLKEYQAGLRFSEYDHEKDDKKAVVNGECDVNIKYLDYVITLYPVMEKRYDKGQYDEVFHTLLHEMCHVLTEPLYSFGYDNCHPFNNSWAETLREQTTQRIAYIVEGLIKPEQIEPVVDTIETLPSNKKSMAKNIVGNHYPSNKPETVGKKKGGKK